MKTISSQTKRFFAAGLIFLLASTGCFSYALSLLYSKKIEATEARTTLARLVEGETMRRSLETAFQSAKESQSQIDSFIVGKDQDIAFLEEIEKLADVAKVAAQNSSVTIEPMVSAKNVGKNAGEKFEYVKIIGVASGPFTNVFHYLRLLEEISKTSRLDDVQLELLNPGAGKDSAEWRLSFVLRTLKAK